MPSTINVNSTRPVTLIPSLPKIITQLFYTYIVYLIFSFFSRDYAQNFFTDSHGNMNYTKIFSRSSRHQQMFGKILVLTNFAKVPRQLLSWILFYWSFSPTTCHVTINNSIMVLFSWSIFKNISKHCY